MGAFFKSKRRLSVCLFPSENLADAPDRVHRMNAGWSPEAFEVVGLREDEAREVVLEG